MRFRFGRYLVVICLLGLQPACAGNQEEEMVRNDRHGRIDVDGTGLYYEHAGDGKAIVLLHAGVADSRMWDAQFTEFARDFRVARLDFRGFGKTQLEPGKFSDFDDVAAVMDAIGFETATIVGSSFGAQVAIDFCLAYPGRVDALVVAAPTVGGHEPSPELLEFAAAEEAALERGDLDAAVELNLRTWVDGRGRDASAVDSTVRSRVGMMQREIFEKEIPKGVVPHSLDPPAAGRLAEISVPTLVIVGEFDLVSFTDLAGWLTERIPNATLVTLPGAHLPNLEAPRAFNEVVRAFILEHDAR